MISAWVQVEVSRVYFVHTVVQLELVPFLTCHCASPSNRRLEKKYKLGPVRVSYGEKQTIGPALPLG